MLKIFQSLSEQSSGLVGAKPGSPAPGQQEHSPGAGQIETVLPWVGGPGAGVPAQKPGRSEHGAKHGSHGSR